jgi:hypothetical protein
MRKQLKEGRIYFGSRFQKFQSMVGWLHYFLSEVRQSIIMEKFSPHGSHEAERNGKG